LEKGRNSAMGYICLDKKIFLGNSDPKNYHFPRKHFLMRRKKCAGIWNKNIFNILQKIK